jgi:hypothetical protein
MKEERRKKKEEGRRKLDGPIRALIPSADWSVTGCAFTLYTS